MSDFRTLYSDISFDLEEGLDVVILKMDRLLKTMDPEREDRIHESYSDVFKRIEFALHEDKEFLFSDLVQAIDWCCLAGWRFGPEEEFSPIYKFWDEDEISFD